MYSFSDHQKAVIKRNPQNFINALQISEAVNRARNAVAIAGRRPTVNDKEYKARAKEVESLKRDLEGREDILHLYKELFPDLFSGDQIKSQDLQALRKKLFPPPSYDIKKPGL